jgi:hypothetical protein
MFHKQLGSAKWGYPDVPSSNDGVAKQPSNANDEATKQD